MTYLPTYEVDGHVVALPHEVTVDPNNEIAWNTWINEIAEETDRRQRARELHNQAEQARVRQRALAEAEKIAAEAKAREILFRYLTPEQRTSWIQHKLFYAEINGKTWKFTEGTHGNVYFMQNDVALERFCIAPRSPYNGGALPVDDVILAQMLLIQADEPEFRRIANITVLRRPVAA